MLQSKHLLKTMLLPLSFSQSHVCTTNKAKPLSMPKSFYLVFAWIFVSFQSCRRPYEPPNHTDFAYAPVYASLEEIRDIRIEGPRNLESPGKIYVKGNYLYVIESFKGIHVINNADPADPVPVAFLQVAGVSDIESQGNFFFVNNYLDLITLDASDPEDIKVIQTEENVFPIAEYQTYPPHTNVYFECVDTARGTVIGWKRTEYGNQTCFR